MRYAWPLFLLLALSACANACDDAPAPSRSVQSLGSFEPQPTEGPPPEGTPVPGIELTKLLPDAIGELKATGRAEPREVELANTGRLTSARRVYAAAGQMLTLEITDTQHAPDVRALVERAQQLARSSEQATFEGTRLQGYKAVLQWHGPGKTALANALVGDRFLVNLQLKPVDSAAPLAALAEQLPLEGLLVLIAREQAAAAEDGSTRAEGADPEGAQPAAARPAR